MTTAQTPLDSLNERRRPQKRAWASLASVCLHGLLAIAVLWTGAKTIAPAPDKTVTVMLIPAPKPAPVPAPPSPAPPSPAPPAPAKAAAAEPVRSRPAPAPKAAARPTPRAPQVLETAEEASDEPSIPAIAELTEAQLAAATTAGSGAGIGSGSGAGGRTCNMVQWLQNRLQQNPEVRAALIRARRAGKATLVWDRGWVRTPGEAGAGLAVVRQAVMVHVAFAPEACKRDAVRGLVVLSLDGSPSGLRLALGSGEWAWADLLR